MIRRYPELKAVHDDRLTQKITQSFEQVRPNSETGRPVESSVARALDTTAQKELDAVSAAIRATENLPNGKDRIKLIELVFWRRSHTLQGAAIKLHVSERTARRWHTDFIKTVARCYGLL